jgi:hypothetical protein
MEARLEGLRVALESGFSAVNRRLDDEKNANSERHKENVIRLVRIEDEAKATNGRVTTLEADGRTFAGQIKEIFRRLSGHRRRADREDSDENETGLINNRRLTQRDAYMIFIGGGALWALVKLIAFIAHVAPAIDQVGR